MSASRPGGPDDGRRALHPREAFAAARAGRLVLVDVRERRETAQGRLVGALALPLSELPQRLGELPAGRPLAFLCTSGRRAAVAARLARQAGHEAHNVRGGLRAWPALRLPIDLR